MATRKSSNKQEEQVVAKASVPVWQFVLVLLLGLGVGWLFGYESGRDSAIVEAVAAGGGSSTPMTLQDSYGRSPGHAHYGHGHP